MSNETILATGLVLALCLALFVAGKSVRSAGEAVRAVSMERAREIRASANLHAEQAKTAQNFFAVLRLQCEHVDKVQARAVAQVQQSQDQMDTLKLSRVLGMQDFPQSPQQYFQSVIEETQRVLGVPREHAVAVILRMNGIQNAPHADERTIPGVERPSPDQPEEAIVEEG